MKSNAELLEVTVSRSVLTNQATCWVAHYGSCTATAVCVNMILEHESVCAITHVFPMMVSFAGQSTSRQVIILVICICTVSALCVTSAVCTNCQKQTTTLAVV